MEQAYPVLRRDYPLNEKNLDFWVNEKESPYTEAKRFDWYRGYQVGGRSLMWGRHSYRWSDYDFEANAKDGVAIDWPIRYADLAPWYSHVEAHAGISGTREGLPQLPDSDFLPPIALNCGEQLVSDRAKQQFGGVRRIIPGRVANLTQATIINPNEGVAFGNLAIALDAQGRYGDAEKAYRRALELDRDDTASLGNLGKNLMRQNKTDQAVAVLRTLADMTESASARKLYADALAANRQHAAALQLYDGILREDAKYYPALNGKGTALIGQYEQGLRLDNKQRAAAIAAWRQSLALNPEQPRVQEMIKKWEQ
jgi:choline dehydrogenase-like flavoprotein